jgi:hypothetical protein
LNNLTPAETGQDGRNPFLVGRRSVNADANAKSARTTKKTSATTAVLIGRPKARRDVAGREIPRRSVTI